MQFCHLHIHNEYSQLDGFGKAKDYVAYVKELNQSYLAITNHGNIDGVLEHQRECEKQDIKPIIGCEAYIVPDLKIKNKNEKRFHITLLVKNQDGWNNLCRMLSIANLEGFYNRPRIDYDLLWNNLDGLVIMTGCCASFLHDKEGLEFFKDIAIDIPDDVYLEIMPINLVKQEETNSLCLKLSKEYDIPLIATADCHYIRKEDKKAQEVLLAIQSGKKWTDKDRWTFTSNHLLSVDEMIEQFEIQVQLSRSVYLRAIENTIEVAEKCCNFRIEKQDISLPDIFNNNEDEILKKFCIERIDNENQEYKNRISEEFNLIKKKRFSKYFLIVKDLIDYCKQNDIMVGPGRGSVGGSLIANLLGITSKVIDPIKYNLLFSRFLSEDRIDYPDIDIDFDASKRNQVIEYMREKYKNVAHISNINRMKSRLAVKDVARVFGVPNKVVNDFTKLIDDDKNKENVIQEAIDETREGKDFSKKYSEVIEIAKKLEGQVRGYGQHAGGIVISDESLIDSGKCVLRLGMDDFPAITWDFRDAEYMGLIKLDILGLRELSVLDEIKRLVKENRNIDIDFDEIPLDDKETLEQFQNGNNFGIFQFSTHGISKLCKEMIIDNFLDLVAINALYRPGTLRSGTVNKYVERRNGKKYKTIHSKIREITKDTYGILVYQEQISMLAIQLAGFSESKADKVRKVISKSKGNIELAKFEEDFVNGCIEHSNLEIDKAQEIWDEIKEFGGYAFNKSHSLEYTLIAYWDQYCKVHYLNEFVCANLSSGIKDNIPDIIDEVYRLGLKISLPKIEKSLADKWKIENGILICPFTEVKGIGDKIAQDIINNPPKKPTNKSPKGFFTSDKKIQQRKNLTKLQNILLDIGAFDDSSPIESVQDYFSFKITDDPYLLYPKLYELLGDNFFNFEINDVLSGKAGFHDLDIIKSKRYFYNLENCNKCELINECIAPVNSSYGIYNIVIIGEAPGPDEDKEGIGFCGKAGKLLWKKFADYGLKRELFHITNLNKCYPALSETPNKKQIEVCKDWLENELEHLQTRLILAFGNNNQWYFRNSDSGITKINGTIEWCEKVGAWICYSVHPAYVLRNRNEEYLLDESIENFVNLIRRMGFED